MKSNKKFIKFAVILFIVAVIAFVVYYFFNDIFKVEGEARLVKMDLPAETQNLTSSLDLVKMDKLDWKDVLVIKGWVFKQNVASKTREVYLVLKSADNTLIFDVQKDTLPRPDVTAYYHLDGGITNYGFEVAVPKYLLKENSYLVGFIVVDQTGKHYSLSNRQVVLTDGVVTVNKILPDMSKPKTSQVTISLKSPTAQIKCGFEKIVVSDNYLNVGGWGFLDGLNSDNLKTYVLLKKNEIVTIYAVDKTIRKDVSNVYKETRLNFDSSGFSTRIPVGNLEKGHYQVGLYIEKGNQCGITYPKYIDISY